MKADHPKIDLLHSISNGWIGLITALLFLLILIFADINITNKSNDSFQLIIHTHKVQTELMQLLSTIQDAETGQRGYLLTNNEQYLEPYKSAIGKIDIVVNNLNKLLTDNPIQQQHLTKISLLIGNKIDELDFTISLLKAKKHDESIVMVTTDVGKQTMDQLRETIQKMSLEEDRLMNIRSQESKSTAQTLVIIKWFSLAFMLIIAVLVYFRAKETTLRRIKNEKQLDRSNIALKKLNTELEILTENQDKIISL